uniref:Uncharacterized protein n=1 Tax=Manihot esculenta TaxID=3983 RepID=A0A2C9WA21_MANES
MFNSNILLLKTIKLAKPTCSNNKLFKHFAKQSGYLF